MEWAKQSSYLPAASSTFTIFGQGKVVKQFLKTNPAPFAIKVFDRASFFRVSLDNNGIIVFACSIDEKAYLANNNLPHERRAVYHPNIAIVNQFLAQGYFNRGRIFVLSNPCELLAEYIRLKSNNSNVYALGLSYDKQRYERVFEKMNLNAANLLVGGNHYDESCAVGITGASPTLHQKIRYAFLDEVASEFIDGQPPIHSGAQVLRHLWEASLRSSPVLVSGYSPDVGCFTGGLYHFAQEKFTAILGSSPSEKKRITTIAEVHKKTLKDLTIL